MRGLFNPSSNPPIPNGMYQNSCQIPFPNCYNPTNCPTHQTRQVAYHKSRWLPIEDELLISAVKIHGLKDWVSVAEMVHGRTAKQCRERYTGHLDPHLKKDDWTNDEDDCLLRLHASQGNQWANISKSLPGRSANSVKNRFNLLTKKRAFAESGRESPAARSQSMSADSFSMSADSFSFSDGVASDAFFETSPPKPPTNEKPEDHSKDDMAFMFDIPDVTDDIWF